MARPPAAVPDGVEMIGEPHPSPDAEPATRTPLWAWVAAAVAVAALLTIIADRRSGTDDEAVHDPRPSGLGVFELDELDLADATPRDEVGYPLFGREWGLSLVVLQGNNVVAVDLDTGDRSILTDIGGAALTTRFFVEARSGKGELYLLDAAGGVLRVTGDEVEWVVEPATDGARGFMLGGWHVGAPDFDPLQPTEVTRVSSLAGDLVVGIGPADTVGVADDNLLLERAEWIVIIDQNGRERPWVTGQLLLTGPASTVWRSCDATSDCAAWAGRADDPWAHALDTGVVLDVRADWSSAIIAGGPTISPPPVLSPDGTLGWRRGAEAFELVDLGDGSSIVLHDIDSIPTFTPDSSAMVTTAGSIPTVIDLATGDMARIRLDGSAGALRQRAVAFLPTDTLLEGAD